MLFRATAVAAGAGVQAVAVVIEGEKVRLALLDREGSSGPGREHGSRPKKAATGVLPDTGSAGSLWFAGARQGGLGLLFLLLLLLQLDALGQDDGNEALPFLDGLLLVLQVLDEVEVLPAFDPGLLSSA